MCRALGSHPRSHRLVVRTSRCGRDNPGSTSGGIICFVYYNMGEFALTSQTAILSPLYASQKNEKAILGGAAGRGSASDPRRAGSIPAGPSRRAAGFESRLLFLARRRVPFPALFLCQGKHRVCIARHVHGLFCGKISVFWQACNHSQAVYIGDCFYHGSENPRTSYWAIFVSSLTCFTAPCAFHFILGH